MDKKKLWLLLSALALIIVLVLVLCISSCEQEEIQQPLPQVGLCLRQYEQSPEYGKLLQEGFQKAGYEVVIQDAKNDQTRQNKQIKNLLKEGAVLLVIEPVMAEATEDAVALLKENNVPAVFVGNKPEAALEKWNKLSFVGSNRNQIGKLQGELILQEENRGDMNEDGLISCLVLSGPETDGQAKLQAEDCINVLIREGLLVEQVESPWGDWTTESGRIRCAKALSQYGKDIEVIFCGNEAITIGALEAVKDGGWQIGRDYLLAGVDAEDHLQTDGMTGTVVFDREGEVQKILSVAKELLKGKTVEQEYYVNLKTVVS